MYSTLRVTETGHSRIVKMAHINRSRKPVKGQIIYKRADYLSFYGFADLLKDR